jgi:hypothetical protein
MVEVHAPYRFCVRRRPSIRYGVVHYHLCTGREREREREKKGVAAAAAAAAAAAITEESWEEIGNSKRVVGWHNSSINNVSGFSTEGDAKKYEVKISFRTSDNPD